MKYLSERSLYYYFLMREAADADISVWNFIAKTFGVKGETVKAYLSVLADATLEELNAVGDIEMYLNYLNGFCRGKSEFGKAEREREAIEAKALALHKAEELFGENRIKGNRLRSLSHNYERDHVASVLYALRLLYTDETAQCAEFAESILLRELEDGRNSDAGLILLSMKGGEFAERLKSLPDMIIRPDMQKYLSKRYGGGAVVLKGRRTIGF